ncbi:MAG TPA: DUF885 domain-containing protein [Thermoanaerobaculia bacterium]|nr:DUF885 domain-containing protein [Thermoanaerobaculia bacterium]
MRHCLASFAALTVFLSGAAAMGPPAEPEPSASSRALAGIIDEYEKYRLETDPTLRQLEGLRLTELYDMSLEKVKREAAFFRSLSERLERLDPAGLTHEECLSREILLYLGTRASEAPDHFWSFFQVTPYSAPFRPTHFLFSTFRFENAEDATSYLGLLRRYSEMVGQLRRNLEIQRSMGILIPRPEIDPVVLQVRSYVRPPDQSLFAVPPARLGKLGEKEAAAFRAEVERIIALSINPALLKLAGLMDAEEYRNAAPERVGLGQYPGGEAAYRYAVRLHTMLDRTPEEIHRHGLAEVERLEARMTEVRKRIGFAGTRDEFHRFVKTDPRFFARTPEEAAERLLAHLRRIEPRISRYFLCTPESPYGVQRLNASLEGAMTYGYYQQATPASPRAYYMFNGSRLDQRPLLSAATIIYHELIPGHHIQVALQLENKTLPAFRRGNFPTAFVEGWADYAAGLAEEMGLYEDPYDLYGRLAQDILLNSRLVVDTGMNLLGWSRQDAIGYLKEHTLESEVQIGTETLRYSVDLPGQALAYKLGENKIRELRRKAERELGKNFDVRRFHDAVLTSGALPLTVLEKHVDWWIGEEKKRVGAPGGGSVYFP